MRHLSILLPALLFACADLSGQEDYSNARFLKMAEVEGTRYIITYMNNAGKFLKGPGASYVLFIDTVSEKLNRVAFPAGTLFDG